jgi:hypothetical protein
MALRSRPLLTTATSPNPHMLNFFNFVRLEPFTLGKQISTSRLSVKRYRSFISRIPNLISG